MLGFPNPLCKTQPKAQSPSRDSSPARFENRRALEKISVSTDLLFVSGGVFQIFEVVGILDLENEYPPLRVRFAVDQARVGFERLVRLDNVPFTGA
jgi:hypothetical protein